MRAPRVLVRINSRRLLPTTSGVPAPVIKTSSCGRALATATHSERGNAHINTAESFFAILKRQVFGTHHAISEAHLQRYVTECEFKWNNRASVGIEDEARANAAIKGAEGKRLTYRRLGETANG